MTFSKGSTYVAVVPLTNSFGLYQILEPEPGQLTPIILVFQWCLMFDTKLKLRYLLSDLKLWHKKSGFVRTQRTNNDQLILVDPVDDEDVEELVHGLILQTSDNAI